MCSRKDYSVFISAMLSRVVYVLIPRNGSSCGGNGGGGSGALSLISSKLSTRFLYSVKLMN
jgi:hypothetical protein